MNSGAASWALVTGASRGIGRAVAVQLAEKLRLNVIVNYNNDEAAANTTATSVRSAGVQCDVVRFDVREAAQVNASIEEWRKQREGAHIGVLVNNAGITRDNLMVFMKPEEWSAVIDTHLHGFFHVTTAVLQGMVRKRQGRIINVVSLSGLKGVPGQTNYSAAKAGVIGATKALAQEVAKRNITVNAVAPGFIATDMTSGLDQEQLRKLVPMERFGTPEEVAAVVAFLAGPEASYITGEVININGGIYS